MELLEREWVRGASWYLEKAIELVSKAEDPLKVVESLRNIRPGMASLDFLYLVLKEAAARGIDVRAVATRVGLYAEEAKRRLDDVIASLECPRRVITLSFSRAVTRFIERFGRCIEVVYLAESKPGVEFSEAYATYSQYAEVVPIPDSALGAFKYDVAVIGLDGLYINAAVNKVGSLPLLATAKARDAVTIAVFESYKAVPLETPWPPKITIEIAGRVVEVPLFDHIPHSLINMYVTDFGIFHIVNSRDIFQRALEKIFM